MGTISARDSWANLKGKRFNGMSWPVMDRPPSGKTVMDVPDASNALAASKTFNECRTLSLSMERCPKRLRTGPYRKNLN